MEKIKVNYKSRNFDFYIHDTKKDLYVSKHIKETNTWETNISNIMLNNMKSDGIFLDIGANIGWHTKVLQEHGYRTISFEPEPSNFELLLKNCEKNDCLLYELALGDESRISYIKKNPTNYGDSYISDDGDNKVEIVKLDDIIDKSIIKNINVIKIDVQGYEAAVLKGGHEFLKKLQDGTTIIIEVNPSSLNKDILIIQDLINRAKSSFALTFWNDAQMNVGKALRACYKPDKKILDKFKLTKNGMEFDLVITL